MKWSLRDESEAETHKFGSHLHGNEGWCQKIPGQKVEREETMFITTVINDYT